MNYHVFIVDENTFKYHLKYKFAGTGAKEKTCPFIYNSKTTDIHSTTERNLVGMIADISRIRIGDKIIFYLQASSDRQGMFFGVFKASSTAFFDENDKDNYLNDEMNKGLSFRILIENDNVYQIGVTEHEYLDSLEHKIFPHQMCWSLIYRKLKGARGCTMITEHEYLDLLNKLKTKNKHKTIDGGLSYNSKQACIQNETSQHYLGRKDNIDISSRMLYKAKKGNAFEVHLQAYILQNLDKEQLKNLLIPFPEEKYWIGNEVSCGVGMQRIDLMIVQNMEKEVYIKIIELKCVQPYKEIVTNQIPWYIQWVSEYIAPNYIEQGKKVHIIPCVISEKSNNGNYFNEVKKFNCNLYATINFDICKFENISFTTDKTGVYFEFN